LLGSAAQLLVDGLELIRVAKGDELHDLIAQPYLGGCTGV